MSGPAVGLALSRGTLDRDGPTRVDGPALERAWQRARVLVVDDGAALLDGTELVLVGPDEAPAGDRLYLGREGDQPYFAVGGALPRRLGSRRLGLREVGAALSDRDAGLLVHAVALLNWHRTHTHCPRCGVPTVSNRGGATRVCPADGTEHFPRTDPAVIMLVHDGGERCLLGRQAAWPAGRYSTLAGFAEPGESAEQAVVREVAEESGVAVRDVAYVGSQPWPFPASLMLGYTAVADPGAQPHPADGELADVRWVSREQLRAGEVLLPPPVSIAHHLITGWLGDDRVGLWDGTPRPL